jgi:hypothetical protein
VLLIRVVCFAISVLLLTEVVGPNWGWYLALWVLCFASFSFISMAAAFISFWLMVGVFEPSNAWHTVMAVFTLVAVLQALTRRQSQWRWQTAVWTSGEPGGRGGRSWRFERLNGRNDRLD